MIPIMMDEVEANHRASAAEMADTIAIAAMSPGPVAVNALIGFSLLLNGFSGVIFYAVYKMGVQNNMFLSADPIEKRIGRYHWFLAF
ncbi:hypothetical protein SCACP_12790 [Sporomusa carbonis]